MASRVQIAKRCLANVKKLVHISIIFSELVDPVGIDISFVSEGFPVAWVSLQGLLTHPQGVGEFFRLLVDQSDVLADVSLEYSYLLFRAVLNFLHILKGLVHEFFGVVLVLLLELLDALVLQVKGLVVSGEIISSEVDGRHCKKVE